MRYLKTKNEERAKIQIDNLRPLHLNIPIRVYRNRSYLTLHSIHILYVHSSLLLNLHLQLPRYIPGPIFPKCYK